MKMTDSPCNNRLECFHQKRDQFTINTVSQSSDKWLAYNWVICDDKHTTAFDGTENVDWGHSHYELDLNFGSAGLVLLRAYLVFFF